jgi:hypothetical protein
MAGAHVSLGTEFGVARKAQVSIRKDFEVERNVRASSGTDFEVDVGAHGEPGSDFGSICFDSSEVGLSVLPLTGARPVRAIDIGGETARTRSSEQIRVSAIWPLRYTYSRCP